MTSAERLQPAYSILAHTLPAMLGDNLIALYQCKGPARLGVPPTFREIDLWLFIKNETSLNQLRQVFLPIWQEYAGVLRHGPAVVTPDDFARYQLIYPDQVRRLAANAELLAGKAFLDQISTPPAAQPEELADLAHAALRFSSLLASDHDRPALARGLDAYVRRYGATGARNDLERLAALHQILQDRTGDLAELNWTGQPPSEPAPPALPGLLALIGHDDQLIVVMPRVDLATLTETNWDEVAELVSAEYNTIYLATPFQLRLAAGHALAADCYLLTFDQIWGNDILTGFEPALAQVVASAAALPVRVLVEQLPSEFLTTPDDKLGTLVHDMQNILLNIQLRNEVMARRSRVTAERPGEPLPGREKPNDERIAANQDHFRWWARHLTDRYASLIPSRPATLSKLPTTE